MSNLFHYFLREMVTNKWNFIVGVWDREAKQTAIYQNGAQVIQGKLTSNNLDLADRETAVFDIGFKRNSQTVMDAVVRDLVLFNRPLTSREVQFLKGKQKKKANQ